jgi:nitrogen-specific signal transduction histidine kinase
VITDCGEGIPEDLIPKVTFPFFTTKDDSLGLGLSFCEVVLEKMEGHLHIESAAKKQLYLLPCPRSFRISFPLLHNRLFTSSVEGLNPNMLLHPPIVNNEKDTSVKMSLRC